MHRHARPLLGPGLRVCHIDPRPLSPELEAPDVSEVDRRREQAVRERALLMRGLNGSEPGRLPRDQSGSADP